MAEVARRAAAAGGPSVLVTFEPHPLAVVNPQAAPPLLTTGAERREILAQLPLDYVAVAAVRPPAGRRSRRRTSSGRSCSRTAGCSELVFGYDHGFGRGRSGDVETLRRLGDALGFGVDVVPPVRYRAASRSRAGGSVARWPAATSDRGTAAGPAVPGERSGDPGRAARAAARRPDDQPRRRAARKAAAARRGLRRVGGVARAGAPAG